MKALTVHFMDCEKEFQNSVFGEKGDGFILDDSIDYGEDYFKKLTFDKIKDLYRKNSIYSHKFGLTLQEDSDVIATMYSCKCGNLIGLDHLDEVCPVCGTIVDRARFKEVGWFYIKPQHNITGKPVKVLHPYLCYLICTVNGGSLARRLDGRLNQRMGKGKKNNDKKLQPIEDFTWRDLFFSKKKLKDFVNKYMKANAELINMYDDVWYTNAIPVISKSFRPLKVKNRLGIPKLDTKDLNTEYQVVSECINAINSNPNMIEEQLVNKLKSIVHTMGNICEILTDEIGDGKKSTWRGEVIAPRLDNSARLIIEPIIDTSIHEVDVVQLPLDCFRVIFSSDVEKICKKLRVAPNKIRDLVDMNYELEPDERIFIREQVFPRVQAPYVYISREPCIYMTSVLGVRVHSLIDEMVMRIPIFILPPLSADYDGDALFVINYGTPAKRKRIYESLGITKSLIDTVDIKMSSVAAMPNNNKGVVMWKGFRYDAEIEEIIN